MKYTSLFACLLILILDTACNAPVQTKSPGEPVSQKQAAAHPNLIKTIGSPKYGNVQCSFQDKDGIIWFGTTENGLYRYDGKSFSRFLMADGLNSNNISCILQDRDGKIWIGTDAGVCLYDGKTFVTMAIPLRKDLPLNKNDYYRNSRWVLSIMQARNGKLWFATINGVYIYDGKSFTPFIINESGVGFMSSNNNVERILEDNAGNMWFGGRGNEGVYRYDGKSIVNLKFKERGLKGFDPKQASRNWAWPQLQDSDGNIWFTNWDGAYRYDGKSFKSFTKKDGLSGDMITRIIQVKNGDLWFGGDGLTRYDGKSFTGFTAKDGLSNKDVWAILEDKAGNLWVGTRETGLYLYDGKTFTKYSEYKH